MNAVIITTKKTLNSRILFDSIYLTVVFDKVILYLVLSRYTQSDNMNQMLQNNM